MEGKEKINPDNQEKTEDKAVVESAPLKGVARLKDYLANNNSDASFEQNDDMIDYLLDRYNGLQGTSNKIAEGIKANPRNAALIEAIMSGDNMYPHVAKIYGKSIRELDPESDEFKAIIEAEEAKIKEDQEAFDRSAQSEKEFNDNLDKSGAIFEEFAKNNNLDEAQFSDILKWAYETIYKPAFIGLYTVEGLEALKKAYDYDNDMDTALEAGEAKGRTQKIRAESGDGVGDGIPSLGGSSGKAILSKASNSGTEIVGKRNRSGWDQNTKPM